MGNGERQRYTKESETDGMWRRIDSTFYHISRLSDLKGRRARQKHAVVADKEKRKHGHYRNLRDK